MLELTQLSKSISNVQPNLKDHSLNTSTCLQKSESDLHKKMLGKIKDMQKRAEQSEFGATNYTQIGDYKMSRHLGAGSYASVKQAVHSVTGMLVAVKIYDK